MTTLDSSNYEYQVGGSLSIHASSYIHRQADLDLYAALQAGHFCYVFNSRQMGKSSLRVQTMHRLKQAGVACIAIDMTRIGSEHLTPQQWYEQVISELWRAASLPGKVNLKTWLQDHPELSLVPLLAQFIEDILLPQFSHSQIIIFIDEIDTVLSIRFPINDFFAFIRACYNQRVDHPQYQRLTFCLLGVATPADLMQDKTRTPFNIGQAIALHGFTPPESASLAQGLIGSVPNPEQTLQEILYWTGGQPFLTQKLCQMVVANGTKPQNTNPKSHIADLVSAHLITAWEYYDEPEHLRTIRDRLLRDEKSASQLLGLYAEILNQGDIPVDEGDGQMELRLTGLVVKQGDRLQVYNPIYAAVFNAAWVQKNLYSLRPYADSFRAWTESDCRDESRLLRGQALEEALTWASTRNLSNLDVEFLRESQAVENRETKQANAILAIANRTAKQRLQIGTVGLGLALAAAAGIGIWSNQTIHSARIMTRLEQNSRNAVDRFNTDQTDALIRALRNASNLKQFAKQERTQKYPTSSPILALQKIVDTIQLRDISSRSMPQLLSNSKGYRVFSLRGDQHENQILEMFDFASGAKLASIHTGEFLSWALSPDDQWIATIGGDCTTRLWNLQNQPVMTFKGHQGHLRGVQFSPDGSSLVTLELGDIGLEQPSSEKCRSQGNSQVARLIDRQGKQHAEFKYLVNENDAIQFNPTGDRLLTLESQANNSQIQLWTLQGKSILRLKPTQKDGTFTTTRFSPNGKWIAAVEMKEEIARLRLWDLQGKELANFPTFQKGLSRFSRAKSIQFSPNGQLMATGSTDGRVRLWNSQGKLIRTFKAYAGTINNLAFSPNGTQLAIAGQLASDNISSNIGAHIWDLQGNRLQPIRTQDGRFSPDGTKIVGERSIEYLHNPHGKPLGQDRGQIQALQFSPTGQHLLAYTEASGKVQVWDRQGNRIAEINPGFSSSVQYDVPVRFNAKGDRILTLVLPEHNYHNHYGVRVWNLQGKQVAFLERAEWPKPQKLPSDYWVSRYIAPPKKSLTSKQLENFYQTSIPSVRIWQLDGKPIATFNPYTRTLGEDRTPTQESELIWISPRGNYILTSGLYGSTLWTNQGQKIAYYKDLHFLWNDMFSPPPRAVYFSQDEQRLIIIHRDPRDSNKWSFSQQDLQGNPIGTEISLKQFVPNPEDCLVSECMGTDGAMQYNPQTNYFWQEGNPAVFWNFDGQPVATVGSSNHHPLSKISESVQFSDRGDRIATSDKDGKVGVWDNYGNQLGEYEGYAMALSPDGKQIVVAQTDNIPRIWRVDDLDGVIQRGCDWLLEKIDMCSIKPK
ncbi:AAA-like domain-containing protein [Phormidium sp. CLA17]|uniref:AAA-like domain-containing protein n=1 Tax=Leptolyngbya sp. Cla-17 TaxID=2803751 RepID=UPI001492F89B|nr:AAA-like domain-containing protein [Leptolyngbya sp. Cla-17]MBM0742306.1 AAA-like domain-containing protein [Leptolyngbya sp. Cla-17]